MSTRRGGGFVTAAWAATGCAVLMLGGCAVRQTEGAARAPEMHLFLLAGQSNMAGRGTVEAEDRVPHPRILMLNAAGEWVPAVDPLHFDKPAAGVGPGLSFLWHQGESDANPRLAPQYAAKLAELLQRFRRDLDAPAVRLLVGQLGQWTELPWGAAWREVDAAHRGLASTLPGVVYVSSAGLAHGGDTLHFSAAGARELGRRYAEAYLGSTGSTPVR